MEYTLEQQVRRADEAQRMLDSEVFKDALLRTRETLIQRWLGTTDEKVHAACWSTIHALAEVETEMLTIVTDGVVAQDKLDRMKK